MNPIGRSDIERMAELSGLDVEPEALVTLTREIASIIEYVSQIGEVETTDEPQQSKRTLPDSFVRLRADELQATNAVGNPGRFAPVFEGGFFTVPRPESMDEG